MTHKTKSFKHILIKVAFMVVLLFICSYSQDELENENVEITSSFKIKINNDQFKFTNASVSGIENCERLSVGVQSNKSAKENFTIVINLL